MNITICKTYDDIKKYIESNQGNGCKLITTKKEFKEEKIKQNKSSTRVKIKILCGQCKQNIFITNMNIFQHNKKQCNDCGSKNRKIKQRKTTEEFKQEIKNNTYEVLGEYINNKTPIKIKCKKCNYIWEVRPDNFLNGTECPNCYNIRRGDSLRMSTQEFITRLKNLKNNYELIGEFNGAKNPVLVQHTDCGYIWSPQAYDLLTEKSICPNCYGKNLRKTNEEFSSEIERLSNGEYEVMGDYINNSTKIKIKHKKCNFTFYTRPNDFLNGRRCPYCNKKTSKGEKAIQNFLLKNKIFYNKEQCFKDCKDKGMLLFDFAIFEDEEKTKLKYLIEYQGIGHYKPIDWAGKGREWAENKFKEYQRRDKLKWEYCKNNNIHLIEIPYWEFDNIKNILNTKIEIAD